jgi:hypothetical protein
MPQLVQFGDLSPAHFAAHPVWVGCHVSDYDQPWYDGTDEETFRPWTEALPVDPRDGMYLVRASFALADGTTLQGFVTPIVSENGTGHRALGKSQPQLFLPSGELVGFWLGMTGQPAEAGAALCAALGKSPTAVFPIRYSAPRGLAAGLTAGEVHGFHGSANGSSRPTTLPGALLELGAWVGLLVLRAWYSLVLAFFGLAMLNTALRAARDGERGDAGFFGLLGAVFLGLSILLVRRAWRQIRR